MAITKVIGTGQKSGNIVSHEVLLGNKIFHHVVVQFLHFVARTVFKQVALFSNLNEEARFHLSLCVHLPRASE